MRALQGAALGGPMRYLLISLSLMLLAFAPAEAAEGRLLLKITLLG